MPRPTHHQVNCWDIEGSLTDNSIIIYCFMQFFDPGSSVSPEITLAQTYEISVQYLHTLLRHSEAVADARHRLILFQSSPSAPEKTLQYDSCQICQCLDLVLARAYGCINEARITLCCISKKKAKQMRQKENQDGRSLPSLMCKYIWIHQLVRKVLFWKCHIQYQ